MAPRQEKGADVLARRIRLLHDDMEPCTFLRTLERSDFHAFQLIDAELEPNRVSEDRAPSVTHVGGLSCLTELGEPCGDLTGKLRLDQVSTHDVFDNSAKMVALSLV